MIFPTTYNEMKAWISVKQFSQYLSLTEGQMTAIYEGLKDGSISAVTGFPTGQVDVQHVTKNGSQNEGQVDVQHVTKNGSQNEYTTESFMAAPAGLNPEIQDMIRITGAGLFIQYTAAYLAAQRASSSDSGGSSGNNNNNNNNNNN